MMNIKVCRLSVALALGELGVDRTGREDCAKVLRRHFIAALSAIIPALLAHAGVPFAERPVLMVDGGWRMGQEGPRAR